MYDRRREDEYQRIDRRDPPRNNDYRNREQEPFKDENGFPDPTPYLRSV